MKLRRSLAVVLCLLLLSLQSQALVHPLSHLGFGKQQDTGIASSLVEVTCAQCALLAGGASAAVTHSDATLAASVGDRVAVRLESHRTTGVPAWFRSRAPPVRLV